MKTTITTILLATAMFLIACSHTAPTAPDSTPTDGLRLPAFWDPPQPPGWQPDGTDMYSTPNAEELRIYFAAHYTEATWIPESSTNCNIYHWWYHIFSDMDFGQLSWIVREYERYRYDIPNERDIEPPC